MTLEPEYILPLIRDYLDATAECVDDLFDSLGREVVRDGPGGGKFPRRGVLRSGREYQFHGIGCTVTDTDADVSVSVDFGRGGRYDGFSPGHLFGFAKERATTYPGVVDKTGITEALQRLFERGIVMREDDPYDRLLYLVGRPVSRL